MNEFDLIARHFRPLAHSKAALGLKDDAALLTIPPDKQLVATTDAIAAGVHFIGNEEPSLIARKLLRVNLSDLAAKGAAPYGYLLNVALSRETDADRFLASFAQGLKDDQERYGIALLGGDTIAVQGPSVFSLTALGLVDAGKALLRSGAKPGDRIFVSGTVGDAYLGLKEAKHEKQNSYLLNRYQLPEPRMALGLALVGIASACMDVSDGLVQDMGQLCTASALGMRLQADRVPLSEAARAALRDDPTLLPALLSGGDDYELLFTVPQASLHKIPSLPEPLTEIGEVTEGNSVAVVNIDGTPLVFSHTGYAHFR